MCIPGLETILATAFGGSGAIVTAGAQAGAMGSVLQMGGALVSAVSQMANANAMAKVADKNQDAANKRALEAIDSGEQESDLARRKGAMVAGANTVAMAANGVDVTSAHAIDLLDDTKENAEQDAFRIRTNAQREAAAYSQQAANFGAEAASARSSAIFTPISTLLGAGGKMYDRWGQYQAGQKYPGTPGTVANGGY